MTALFDFISRPLGQVLYFIYNTVAFRYYGLAIIIFTLLIKVLLLPLSVKQYRSTSKMQQVQPQIQDLQRRYKNDKEKMNQELMKLYKENNVNPAGGCLPMFVQLPILISLYRVIQSPLQYMFKKTAEVVGIIYDKIPDDAIEKVANLKDISIINYFTAHSDKLAEVAEYIQPKEILDLNFLGVFNLGMIPKINYQILVGEEMKNFIFFSGPLWDKYLPLVFIPILAAVTTFISLKYTTPAKKAAAKDTKALTAKDDKAAQSMQGMQGSMTYMMPLVTAFFAFSVPAGLGLYWIISNLVQMLQQMYMNRFIIKKKEAEEK
ncbi:MAG: YidC/Oxa1 family membrane protein insertase [Eubacteriales bacterium]|nr:YidC/Oxa1 family membrane protein insertase [Eubacteriales bacterium]